MSFLAATGRSLIPGTVARTTSKPPGRPFSSLRTARPMSQRANVVSATPMRRLLLARQATFHHRQAPLQREVLRDLRDNLPRPRQIALELREPHDLRPAEAAPSALFRDARLVVRLVVPERDHVRPEVRQNVEDLALPAEHGPVDGLQRRHHLHVMVLRGDRPVLEPLRGAVAGDHDDELVPELPRLGQVVDVARVEQVEHPGRHHADHARHASRISRPSRKTRFRAPAYAFASAFRSARPSSPSISQIVALGTRPAICTSAVTSSVWPFRSSRRRGAGFRSATCPGARNSSTNARSAHPFSRRSPSRATSANREIVRARSSSVTPVYVSRWLTVIENAERRSYGCASGTSRRRIG